MIFAKTIGRKIDFFGNFFAESTVYYFVIIINFIFYPLIKGQRFRIKSELGKMKLIGLIRDHPPA